MSFELKFWGATAWMCCIVMVVGAFNFVVGFYRAIEKFGPFCCIPASSPEGQLLALGFLAMTCGLVIALYSVHRVDRAQKFLNLLRVRSELAKRPL